MSSEYFIICAIQFAHFKWSYSGTVQVIAVLEKKKFTETTLQTT